MKLVIVELILKTEIHNWIRNVCWGKQALKDTFFYIMIHI